MTKPIVLYDQNHERVGETYPRRAKQLIRNGRATWLEEGQSLLLATNHEPYPPEQEEPIMTAYQNNGTSVPPLPPPETHEMSDDLLLYLAKKNVAEKRSLLRHAIAYVLALVILFAATSVRHTNVVYFEPNVHFTPTVMEVEMPPMPTNIDVFMMPNGVDLSFYLAEAQAEWLDSLLTLERYILDSITTEVQLRTPHRRESRMTTTVEPLQVFTNTETVAVNVAGIRQHEQVTMFFVGAMATWGLWIAALAFKVWRRRAKSVRVPVVSAVELEYQRLQSQAGSM